jgi:hypothetical protein
MEESYTEGVAIHGGREPCVGVCEDAGEASVAVHAGRAIEPRNVSTIRGADAVLLGGRPHRRQRYRELPGGPARSENLGMRGISLRENREVPCSPARLITGRAAQGRPRPHA